jgi:hypothetical protein
MNLSCHLNSHSSLHFHCLRWLDTQPLTQTETSFYWSCLTQNSYRIRQNRSSYSWSLKTNLMRRSSFSFLDCYSFHLRHWLTLPLFHSLLNMGLILRRITILRLDYSVFRPDWQKLTFLNTIKWVMTFNATILTKLIHIPHYWKPWLSLPC